MVKVLCPRLAGQNLPHAGNELCPEIGYPQMGLILNDIKQVLHEQYSKRSPQHASSRPLIFNPRFSRWRPRRSRGSWLQGSSVLRFVTGDLGFPRAEMSESIRDNPNRRLSHAGVAIGDFALDPRPSSRGRQAVPIWRRCCSTRSWEWSPAPTPTGKCMNSFAFICNA